MRRTLLFETHMNADGQCRINVLRSFSYNACLPVECLLSFFFFLVFASTLYALSQRIVILSVREINPPLVCRSSSVSFVCPLAHVFARVYALFMRVEKFPVAFRFHIAITGKGEWNSVNYRVLKCIWHPALHFCFIIVISMMSNMPYSISETLCHVLSTHSHSHLSF